MYDSHIIQHIRWATVNTLKSQPATSYSTIKCTHILIVIHYTARQLYSMYGSHIIQHIRWAMVNTLKTQPLMSYSTTNYTHMIIY